MRCSRKYLFLKYGSKIRVECLEMLEADFFRGFPVLMASSLGKFCRHIHKYAIFAV